MLAGYLPFDDDPANPEGDNINLLYKYIVSTPLTFPEYVTPHARDLLRRILVPDPRRRADLFEVARHSWLSEYSHVVGFIGSSTKSDRDIATSAIEQNAEPMLGRSASVREPTSKSPVTAPSVGRSTQPTIAADETADARNKQQRDAKRRTVQLEYVAPQTSSGRGETSPVSQQPVAPIAGAGKTRARADSQGPVEVPQSATSGRSQQIPRKEIASTQGMPPPARPTRDEKRATSDSTAFGGAPAATSRPNTRGTLGSRGNSYSQPAVATSTNENVQGHFSQPKSGSGYIISGPMSPAPGTDASRPSSQQDLAKFQQPPQQAQQIQQQQQQMPQRGHKRSSTLSSLTDRVLGRSNSRRQSQQGQQQGQEAPAREKKDRKYPPVSMQNAMPNANDEMEPRKSTESRRSSLNLFRKKSKDYSDAPSEKRNSRRFSNLLPASWSMNSFSGKQNQPYDSVQGDGGLGRQESVQRSSRPASKGMAFGRGTSRSPSQSTTNSTIPLYYEPDRENQRNQRRSGVPQHMQGTGEKPLPSRPAQGQYPTPPPVQRKQFRDDGYGNNMLNDSQSRPEPPRQQSRQQDPPERFYTPTQDLDQLANQEEPRPDQYNPAGGRSQYQRQGYHNNGYGQGADLEPTISNSQNIRPNQRKFNDEYNQGHGGSSSGARRVMDFFRRRGKDRTQQ